ncbi:DUF2996 domain-containing protein [Altericista sp. CCNU0014]|uniref:DUF2996 domain-containing protein n=1 Tax=Altericista sp. CCNU0014 TaxID=3082949 RepID=UPI00384AD129
MADETAPQPQERAEAPQAKAAKAGATEQAKAAKAPKVAVEGAEGAEAPKAKAAKKETLEDKPFPDFISQDYLPALEKAFAAKNVSDLELSFVDNQVSGQWLDGQRRFTVYFAQPNLNAARAFSCATGKAAPSTLEPFLGDERKITLDLLVFGVIQRLNAQKWFGSN